MAGQTDCSTSDGADLKTIWARDSALRITQLTRPDGSCVFSSYDTSGRLYQVKRRDDCMSTSSGDYQQYVYSADGQITEVDTYNASATLMHKQPYTYYNSRRLQNIVNPSTPPGMMWGAFPDDDGLDGGPTLHAIELKESGGSR